MAHCADSPLFETKEKRGRTDVHDALSEQLGGPSLAPGSRMTTNALHEIDIGEFRTACSRMSMNSTVDVKNFKIFFKRLIRC